MKHVLNVHEFDLIAYLHEYASGFEPQYALDLSVLAEAMGRGFSRAISYLKGINYANVLSPNKDGEVCSELVYLTIKGEAAARALERRLIEKGVLIDGTPSEIYSALQRYPVSCRADIVQDIQEPSVAVRGSCAGTQE